MVIYYSKTMTKRKSKREKADKLIYSNKFNSQWTITSSLYELLQS